MRLDRSSDVRKAPQQWTDKLTQPPSRSDGSWKWVILVGALATVLLLGAMAFVMFVAVERREVASREQSAQRLPDMGKYGARSPQDSMSGPPMSPYLTPSMPDDFVPGRPPVDYSSIPGVPKTPFNVQDGASNSFVFPQVPRELPPGFSPQIQDGWGSLKGRFVVVGELPKLPPLKITGDDEFVRQCDVRNESVVVGPAGELANVVIYLAARSPAVHPDYAAAANAQVTLRTEKCRFEPRVCLLRSTQTLKLVSADPIAHEPHVYLDGQGWSATLTRDEPQTRRLRAASGLGLLECDIHRWMRGWILVRDDPYMAVTGKDGSFEIKNLPGGVDLALEVWHEVPGLIGRQLDPEGRFAFIIPANKTHDLGTIEVPAELLHRKGRTK